MKQDLSRKRKFEDEKPINPVVNTEHFAQFAQKNNGVEIINLEIKNIETARSLFNYLGLNPDIKKLTVFIHTQWDEATALLASNKTLNHLALLLVNDTGLENRRLDQGFAALGSNRSLTNLSLGCETFSLEGINQLSNNPVLKTFHLYSLQQNEDTIRIISTLPNLEEFHPSLGNLTMTQQYFSHLLKKRFQTLIFTSADLDYDRFKILSSHPTLTNLELRYCTNEMAALLLRLQNLKKLRIIGANPEFDDRGLDFIAQHHNITDLNLVSVHNISYPGIELLVKMKKEVLKSFSLSRQPWYTGIGNLWIRLFLNCTALTSLALKNCNIGPEGAAFLSEMKNLEHLDLNGNPLLGDDGACRLSTLRHLRSLYVGGCGIGDKGITALVSNSNLHRLYLTGNPQIGLLGLIALAFSTLTELNFEFRVGKNLYNYQLACLFLLGNQTLRYFCPAYHGENSSYGNDFLISLGGRNFSLQKQHYLAVKRNLLEHASLHNDLANLVVEYIKGEYPYRYQLVWEKLSPQERDKLQQIIPEIKLHFTDLERGCKLW